MRLVVILVSLCLALPARAHEYWIEPKSYQLPAAAKLTAGLFNGQNFSGAEFSFFPDNFRRFDLALGDRVVPVTGRTGDKPALAMVALGDGLHVAIFESSGDTVVYADLAAFTRFVTHKDFRGALARHAERGLPQVSFGEYYTRHAKALIAAGSGAGQDRVYGLETEIVALKNPYTDVLADGDKLSIPVRVLYRGAPRADTQVELFDKDAAGKVTITLHRTDADGVAVLPVMKGHSYLADAVVLREPEPGSPAAAKGMVWESLWAALTFAVPQ